MCFSGSQRKGKRKIKPFSDSSLAAVNKTLFSPDLMESRVSAHFRFTDSLFQSRRA